ncbi:unnamed protein product [Phytomonas sp. EM1]|nr:unnamed protein product [Phytomonas sp. EM1]|eukprot:CCW62317.1 unnamed protein product [Phytomonas sp. isolate EM1]
MILDSSIRDWHSLAIGSHNEVGFNATFSEVSAGAMLTSTIAGVSIFGIATTRPNYRIRFVFSIIDATCAVLSRLICITARIFD